MTITGTSVAKTASAGASSLGILTVSALVESEVSFLTVGIFIVSAIVEGEISFGLTAGAASGVLPVSPSPFFSGGVTVDGADSS